MLRTLVALLLAYLIVMAFIRLWRPSYSDEEVQRQMERVRQRRWDQKW